MNPLISELQACQDHIWRPLFKSHTFRSKSIVNPKSFLSFLEADSIVLDLEDSEEPWKQDIQDLMTQIQTQISQIGGLGVVPKLNWSIPQYFLYRDATWMQPLRCTTSKQVLLLLKSSDISTEDAFEAYSSCRDFDLSSAVDFQPVINLIRYHKLNQGMEFRCFVYYNRLVGISQKHIDMHYDYLTSDSIHIQDALSKFINETVISLFPLSCCNIYIDTVDVYLDIPPVRRCWILNFTPWRGEVSTLLLDWNELENTATPIYRVIENSVGIQPVPFSSSRVPIEMTESSFTDLEEFIRQVRETDFR